MESVARVLEWPTGEAVSSLSLLSLVLPVLCFVCAAAVPAAGVLACLAAVTPPNSVGATACRYWVRTLQVVHVINE